MSDALSEGTSSDKSYVYSTKRGELRRALSLTGEVCTSVFDAVRSVIHAEGEPGPRARRLLSLAAWTLDVEATRAVETSAEALARVFPEPRARRALVDALVLVAAIEGRVGRAGERAVTEVARSLGVASPWVDLLPALRQRRVFTIKRQLLRHSPDARRIFRRTWEEEGVLGLWRVLVFVLGLYRDPSLAARFRSLSSLPKGTFGRSLVDDFDARGLSFPGEKGGIPERMVHHDLVHVLNGYDPDPAGECEVGGFYAGFAEGESFTFLMIALATFHLALPVSPAVVVPAEGALDPERVLAAFLRGRRLKVDVMGPWNYWELFPLTMAEARAHLGISDDVTVEPRGPERASV